MTQATIVETQTQQTLIGPQTGAPFELIGFTEALQKLEQNCANPRELMSRENALYALVTINGVGGGLISGLSSSTISATVLNGATILATGATQLHSFFSRHFSIQERQEMLIRAIADANVGDKKTVERCTTVGGIAVAKSAEAILEALSKSGGINIELENGEDIPLKNNGICSIRLVVGSVVTLGLSAGFAAMYGYFQYQAISSGTGVPDNTDTAVATTSSEVWASLAGASVPFNSIYDYLIRSIYKQELDLLKAVNAIVQLYQRANKLHELPIQILQVANHYIDEDSATTNYNILAQAQAIARIETSSQVQALEIDAANQKIDQLQVALKDANTSLDSMKQKMDAIEHDVEMQHTMTASEVRDLNVKIELLQQHNQGDLDAQETDGLLNQSSGKPILNQALKKPPAPANSAGIEGSRNKAKPVCTIC